MEDGACRHDGQRDLATIEQGSQRSNFPPHFTWITRSEKRHKSRCGGRIVERHGDEQWETQTNLDPGELWNGQEFNHCDKYDPSQKDRWEGVLGMGNEQAYPDQSGQDDDHSQGSRRCGCPE
jgi:hypothetical protein